MLKLYICGCHTSFSSSLAFVDKGTKILRYLVEDNSTRATRVPWSSWLQWLSNYVLIFAHEGQCCRRYTNTCWAIGLSYPGEEVINNVSSCAKQILNWKVSLYHQKNILRRSLVGWRTSKVNVDYPCILYKIEWRDVFSPGADWGVSLMFRHKQSLAFSAVSVLGKWEKTGRRVFDLLARARYRCLCIVCLLNQTSQMVQQSHCALSTRNAVTMSGLSPRTGLHCSPWT